MRRRNSACVAAVALTRGCLAAARAVVDADRPTSRTITAQQPVSGTRIGPPRTTIPPFDAAEARPVVSVSADAGRGTGCAGVWTDAWSRKGRSGGYPAA